MDDHIKGMESCSSHASERLALQDAQGADDEAINIDDETIKIEADDNKVVKI